jgi:hypothetical protein
MKRRATFLALCLVLLLLAPAATTRAAAPIITAFTIDTSTGPYNSVDVDGDLIVWLDSRRDPDAGLMDVWAAVLVANNTARAFEIAVAGSTSLEETRVSGNQVVWGDGEDYETGDPPGIWEAFVDKDRESATVPQLIGEGRQPDVHDGIVVWVPGAGQDPQDTLVAAYYGGKRRPHRVVREIAGAGSPGIKWSPRLDDDLLFYGDEPPEGESRLMAAFPWQTVVDPFPVAEGSRAHAASGWTVSYGRWNPDYGWFAGDVYAARIDPVTLAVTTLKLTSTKADIWSDTARDLVVWLMPTKVPGGSGHALMGAFVDWSANPPIAHEFVIADAGVYVGQPAVDYDEASNRYLVIWPTQAIDDYNDNGLRGAWITLPASWDAAESAAAPGPHSRGR